MADLIAVLDANVLYAMSLCDTLLRCAQAGLYQPLWSAEILDEFTRNLIAQGRITAEQAARRVMHMQLAFPQAFVAGYDDLIAALRCEPKDRHVLAAAIHGKAQTIVTKNMQDFPATALQPYGIEVQHPGAFLIELYELDAATVVRAIRQQVAALRNPPMSVPEVLDTLALHVPDFVSHIRPAVTANHGT